MATQATTKSPPRPARPAPQKEAQPGGAGAGLLLLTGGAAALAGGGLYLMGQTQRELLRLLLWELNFTPVLASGLGALLLASPLPLVLGVGRRTYWLTDEHLQIQRDRKAKRAKLPRGLRLRLAAPLLAVVLPWLVVWAVAWQIGFPQYRFPEMAELELVTWVPQTVDFFDGPMNLYNKWGVPFLGAVAALLYWMPLAPYWERWVVSRAEVSTRGKLPDPGDYQRQPSTLLRREGDWRPWPTMLLGAREYATSREFEPEAEVPSWVEYGGKPIFGGMLIFGQKGSGKTSLIKRLLEDLIRFRAADHGFKAAVVAIDPKGDLSDFLERTAATYGRSGDVVRLGVGTRAKWNPFGLLGPRTTSQEAKQAGYFLRCAMSSGGSEDSYWDDNADNLLTYSIHLLALSGERVGFDSLSAWVTKLKDGDDAVRIAQYDSAERCLEREFEGVELERRRRELETTRSYFEEEFVHLDKKPRSIVVNVCTNFLRRFEATEYVDAFCCDPTVPGHFIGFPELIRQGKIFVLDIRATENGAIAGAMAMLAKLYYQAAVKQRDRYEPDWDTRPVKRVTATVWDEYQSYVTTSGGGKQGDAEYLETSRSFYAVDIAATQQLSSIQAAVGGQEAAGQRIAGSFNNLVSFLHNDPALARYLQTLVGQTKREQLRLSVSEGVQGAGKDYLGTLREAAHSVNQQVQVAESMEERLPLELFASLQAFEAVGLFTSAKGRALVRFCSKPYFADARQRHAHVVEMAMKEGSG